MPENKQPIKIVVVGGGAAGLEFISFFNKKLRATDNYQLMLIDNDLVHVWKPLLHEVATGTLHDKLDEIDYISFASSHQCIFVYGSFKLLSRENKLIILSAVYDGSGSEIIPERQIAYDYLILATGSIANDFAISGVSKHCYFLDRLSEARNFHQLLLTNLLTLSQNTHTQKEKIIVAIVGGGATGCELAAELVLAYNVTKKFRFPVNKRSALEIVLIEAANRILNPLPEQVSSAISNQLAKMGIVIHTQTEIVQVKQGHLITKDQTIIPFEICIWVAGIKSSIDATCLDGLATNRLNQIKVGLTLQSLVDENIFAMGDCAECPIPHSSHTVPPRAQAAHQQARLLASSLYGYLYGKKLKEFHFRDYGSLIHLSNRFAAGNLKGGKVNIHLFIQGRIARWIYLLLFKRHLASLVGWWRVIIHTLANLLTEKGKNKLKLH